MARCEDYPCCGHELGCCPDFDEETGQQLNMVCVCGTTVPIDNPSSLCDSCLNSNEDDPYDDDSGRADWEDEDDDEYDDE